MRTKGSTCWVFSLDRALSLADGGLKLGDVTLITQLVRQSLDTSLPIMDSSKVALILHSILSISKIYFR